MNLESISTPELTKIIKILLTKYDEYSTISEKQYLEFKTLQAQEEKKIRLSMYFLWMLFFMILGLILPSFVTSIKTILILFSIDIILFITSFILIYIIFPIISYNRVLTHRIRISLICCLYSSSMLFITCLIYLNTEKLNLSNVILFTFFVYILVAACINAFQNFLENKIFKEIEFYISQKRYFNDKYYEDIFKYETSKENDEFLLKRQRYFKKIQEYKKELKRRK